ncbi:MAG: KH domain-containing protein [Candidatus Korarchaeum sp.]|nr:KH domain-containing protein [Candidatus Korarchaeum sp.]MDW8035338.1 KH domain-containing protein [Candidatus Korarchaeum sp.]
MREIRVLIPKERVGVLIGRKGSTKARIEELTKTRIDVDSTTGEVVISFPEPPEDPLMPMKLESVVRAIGRGFNPEVAVLLLEDDYVLEVIDIRRFVGDTKNALTRMRGRLIGEKGRTRTYIEERTNTKISVYGHTVSIIGRTYDVIAAREAVISLLEGSMHSTAYRLMERKIAEMSKKRIMDEMMLDKALREE